MNITCNVCGYEQNPKGAEFCDACGAELATEAAAIPTPPSVPPIPSPVVNIPAPSAPTVIQESVANIPQPTQPPSSSSAYPDTLVIPVPQPTPVPIPQPVISVSTANTARLVAKQVNAPVPEFSIGSSALVGIFDSDQGPVDIDLENFAGGETISRQHAEIYLEGGIWKVKDLGSMNGVFIKPGGQSRFNARIVAPTPLNPGDEIAIAKVCFVFQSP
jgi:FHA domain